MKSRNLKTRITGAILTFSLLLGIGIASSVTAQAQYPNDQYGRRDRNYEREQRRREREQRRLEREQRRNQRRSGSYGNYGNNGYGNNGYGYGNQDNYANYGGSHQLRQTALNAGYNNGMEEGRRDRERNERFDYSDEADFQRATQDYNSRLGDRETFRRYFRDAFARGYRDGYGSNTGYGYQRY